jgi:hypothetical protein
MKDTATTTETKAVPLRWGITGAVNIMRLIHRKDDGYVGFYSPEKGTGKWRCLGGIRAESLGAQFPQIADNVIDQEDVYFTVNGYWPGRKNEGRESMEHMRKSETFLRSLNACYVDLDVGRTPIEKPDQPEAWQSWRQAAATVGEMADRGEIPQPSIFAQSGRGLYVFWLLRDKDNPNQSPPAFRRHQDFYKRINAAIQERLQCLAPDPAAKDCSRVLRVPGSKHRNGQTVKYCTQHLESGEVPEYTMDELGDWFNVHKEQQERRAYNPNKVLEPYQKRGRAGLIGLNRKRGNDLERLAKAKAIRSGCRRVALTVYAQSLRLCETPRRDAFAKVREMSRKCSPPYPSGAEEQTVDQIIDQTFRMKWGDLKEGAICTTDYLCRKFNVTCDLARELKLETIVPEAVKQERDQERRSRPKKAQKRLEFICLELQSVGSEKPSLRDLAKRATEAGHKCSHEQVRRDLKFLSLAAAMS